MTATIEAIAGLAKYYPRDVFTPNPAQVPFFMAPHRILALFTGNRFGKSICMGVKATDVVRVPKSDVIWVCPELNQFEQIRQQILEPQCLDHGYEWNASKHFYHWPNKSRLLVFSNESGWDDVQGTAPKLVCIDEQCDLMLYRELLARVSKTMIRYIIAATPTKAESWMEHLVYRPWLDHHAALGLTEDQAIAQQLHPDIWCLPRGGIEDNQTIPATERVFFSKQAWGSEKEWKVRNKGGFLRLAGDGVFDASGVEWLRGRISAGENGSLEVAA